jgi:hypothetical protein
MKRFDEIRDLVMSLEGDFEKFYDKGNQAAGTRVRKGMQDLKNLAQDIRVEVQNQKNTATEKSNGTAAKAKAPAKKAAPAKKTAAKK